MISAQESEPEGLHFTGVLSSDDEFRENVA